MTQTARDKAHHGRKLEPVRWTIKKAAEEFGVDNHTISKRIKFAGILPGADDCFSTKDIVDALYGGTAEKLRKAQIEDTTNSAALKKVKTTNLLRENIPIGLVEKAWSNVIVDFRQKINNLDLPNNVRAEILADLVEIPIDDYFTGMVKDGEEDEEETT